jgi:hypothetical protein
MSPVIKFEDLPAVSLLLGNNEGSAALTLTKDSGDQTSRAALMQLIYELLLLVGENVSEVQTANAQTQLIGATIAEKQANAAQVSEQELTKELDKQQTEQAKAQEWGTFGTVMKWVGVGLSLVIGALLCETPIGFAILAATIAFTASPLFNDAVSGLATEIGKIPGISPEVANILAEVVVIVVVTAASFGAEAATVGIKGGISLVEDGSQLAVKAAQEESEEVGETAAEEVSEGSQTASKSDATATNSANETSAKTQTYRTAATTNAFLQTLLSSNVLPNAISEIPGVKKYPWLVALLSIVAELAAALAAYKITPFSGEISVLGRLSSLTKLSQDSLKVTIATITGLTSTVSNSATIGQGYNELKQSDINKKIAPIQSQLIFQEGFTQIMMQLTSIAQQAYKQSMVADQEIFKIDFSSDMRGCVAAQQYQA